MKANPPLEKVFESIRILNTGNKAEIPAAYAELQKAVIGDEGCLRSSLPLQVDWADGVWNQFLELITHENNHVRSIAGQMLANLALSADPEVVLRSLDKMEAVTCDEMFVTARHVLQSLWKVGLANAKLRREVVERCSNRFRSCVKEKNGTLVRHDLQVGLRALFDATGDEEIKARALELISTEEDPKYRKKYQATWRESST